MAKVVALLGSDVAQAGTAAHDVDDHARQFRAGQIRNAFLHQAEARVPDDAVITRTPAEAAPYTMLMEAVFALGLHERAADFRKIQRGGFGDFAGGGDGISVIGAASGQHGAFDDRNVAFTKLPHVGLLRVGAGERSSLGGGSAGRPRSLPAPGSNKSRCRSQCSLSGIARWMHTIRAQLRRQFQTFRRAGLYAQPASLALLDIDRDCCRELVVLLLDPPFLRSPSGQWPVAG
jgi:hypothetical protein